MAGPSSLPDVQYVFFRKETPPFITGEYAKSFAHKSVVERLPAILKRLRSGVCVPKAFAGDLADELTRQYTDLVSEEFCDRLTRILREDDILPTITSGPHKDKWNQVTSGFHSHHMPWLTLEAVFYRLVMDEVAYFSKGLDPFRPQKLQALIEAEPIIRHIESLRSHILAPSSEAIASLLNFSLWSNAVDLSRHPEGLSAAFADSLFHGMAEKKPNILINDTKRIVDLLNTLPIIAHAHESASKISSSAAASSTPGTGSAPSLPAPSVPSQNNEHGTSSDQHATCIIIVDNAGMELLSDLLWADVLLSSKRITQVEFHVKFHPTFVSDVTRCDVEDTLVFVEKISPELGKRWRSFFASGAFSLFDHSYYNAYEPFWIVPIELYQKYQNAEFVVSKGDANCRRFHGDRAWDFNTPTAHIISYFPVPLLLVRTFKSETVSGVSREVMEDLAKAMKRDWYHSGEYGTIQLVMPNTRLAPLPNKANTKPITHSTPNTPTESEDTAAEQARPLAVSAPQTQHQHIEDSDAGSESAGASAQEYRKNMASVVKPKKRRALPLAESSECEYITDSDVDPLEVEIRKFLGHGPIVDVSSALADGSKHHHHKHHHHRHSQHHNEGDHKSSDDDGHHHHRHHHHHHHHHSPHPQESHAHAETAQRDAGSE